MHRSNRVAPRILFLFATCLLAGVLLVSDGRDTNKDASPREVLAAMGSTRKDLHVTPVALGYVFGRRVLKIPAVLLLGAITGSMTSGASLSVVTKEARSPVPALGYTGAYAFANVLLTIAGSVILFF